MEEQADTPGEIDLNPTRMVEQIDSWLDGFVRILPNLGVSLLFLILAWFIARWVGRIITRSARSRGRDNLGEVLGSFTRWGLYLFAVLLALTIVIPSLSPGDLVAGLGVSSVAIGFAFKDILQNWLAGILILLRQPFNIGDQIVSQGHEGTVERIESRATIIKTYDNQRVVIPNSDIYTDAVIVRTANAQRRSEYDIGIGYADDIDEACTLILEALGEVEGVATDPAPEALPWGLDASWVTIRARWWTKSDRATVVQTIAKVLPRIKGKLDEAGIDMPYETGLMLFHDQTEESDGDRARQREGWPVPKDGEPPRPRQDLDREVRKQTAVPKSD
ncbi:mechanosensitive ion channel family protein [Minwuia sp.]|uniref:mechanosensitive ion channel family protein n=1 Tax=Minwuia sp. TaxID=2493630 RepID=UPI003A94DEA9